MNHPEHRLSLGHKCSPGKNVRPDLLVFRPKSCASPDSSRPAHGGPVPLHSLSLPTARNRRHKPHYPRSNTVCLHLYDVRARCLWNRHCPNSTSLSTAIRPKGATTQTTDNYAPRAGTTKSRFDLAGTAVETDSRGNGTYGRLREC